MTSEAYHFRDPLLFPQITDQQLHEGEEGVWVSSPGVQTTRPRVPPTFHDVPSGESIFPDLSPTTYPVIYPPAFALARNNAILTGYRTLLGMDATFCSDEGYLSEFERNIALNRLSASDEFNNEATGLVRNGEESFLFDERDRPVIEHAGQILIFCSTEPSNYGSFLFRILPKIKTMQDAGLDGPILVPVYTQSMRDLLALAGINESRIVPHYANAIYKIDRAILFSLRNSQAYLDEASIDFYRDLRSRYGQPSQGRKIYLTRKNMKGTSLASGTRVMQNEQELISRLEVYGFEIVESSRLSALEQIRLFSSAGLIVGPSGSAMFNTVFCHPGTKIIDIESEPHWIHAHMCLFGSLGLNYGIFEGEVYDRDFSVAHKPFFVNVDALMSRIAEFDQPIS